MTLREIANRTKISVGVLESLERSDISKLPGGIFSRGFVRSYAKEVGLDPDTTVEEFIGLLPHDSVDGGAPAIGPGRGYRALRERSKGRELGVLDTVDQRSAGRRCPLPRDGGTRRRSARAEAAPAPAAKATLPDPTSAARHVAVHGIPGGHAAIGESRRRPPRSGTTSGVAASTTPPAAVPPRDAAASVADEG